MTTLDATWTPSKRNCSTFGTTATDEPALTSSEQHERQVAWDSLIDRKFIEWAEHPESLVDEGVEPPSRDIISQACQVSWRMRDQGAAPPTAVVPNGEGGIVFERAQGSVLEAIEVHAGGSIEYRLFDDCRLVHRETVG